MFKKKNPPPTRRAPSGTPLRPSSVYSYRASRLEAERKVGREGQVSAMTRRVVDKTSWKLIPSYIAIGAMVISFIYVIFLGTQPRIIVSGAITERRPLLRSMEAYEAAAAQVLSQNILNRNKLTINTTAVTEKMLERFPELAQANVVLQLTGHQPVITISPATPAFILAAQDGVFLIDDTGRAMIPVSEVPNLANLGLLTIADQSELEITPGKGALPARDVAFIQQLIAQFDSKKIAVESLTLPPLARELHVKIKNQPYYVKFNLDADMQQQAGSYFAVIEKLTGEKGIPKEYIDVRVEEKVYYR